MITLLLLALSMPLITDGMICMFSPQTEVKHEQLTTRANLKLQLQKQQTQEQDRRRREQQHTLTELQPARTSAASTAISMPTASVSTELPPQILQVYNT